MILDAEAAAAQLGTTVACARAMAASGRIPKGKVWTEKDVANHLGITVARVRDLAPRPGFPFSRYIGKTRRWLSDNFEGFSLDQVKRTNPKCHLYYHYDKQHNLLYVGISLSAIGRLRQHNQRSHWADEIRTITVEHYDSVEEARIAEAQAIATERPRYNKALNWNRNDD